MLLLPRQHIFHHRTEQFSCTIKIIFFLIRNIRLLQKLIVNNDSYLNLNFLKLQFFLYRRSQSQNKEDQQCSNYFVLLLRKKQQNNMIQYWMEDDNYMFQYGQILETSIELIDSDLKIIIFLLSIENLIFFNIIIRLQSLKKNLYTDMKSTSNVYLLPKGAIKPNSKLRINKQSSIQKGSMHLAPIIKITPSKTINYESNQKRLNIVSVSKRKQLKINDQKKEILCSQSRAFQIHLITNTQSKTNLSKTEYNAKNRSISKNCQQINEDEKIPQYIKNIQIKNAQKQFLNNLSEQILKENILQSNQSICIQNELFNQKTIKFDIQEQQGKPRCIQDAYPLYQSMNSKEFPENNQSINNKKSIYFSIKTYPHTSIEKDSQISIIDHKATKSLSLNSNLIVYKLSFQYRQIQHPSNLLNITQQNEHEKLIHLDTIKQSIKEQITLLQESRSIKCQLQLEINTKQLQLQQLQYKLNHIKQGILNFNKQYQLIINFSRTQENNKILKMVSKDYLQLQSEIYEYAVYLQSNQLANDVNYEPRPFSEIQRLISQREKELKEGLFENGKQVIDKSLMMSEFISETMRLLKKKDAEMQRLTNFRAKCILQFVAKMKIWLNNWQLKQEYLSNIKMQFAATLILLRRQMFTLEEKICEKELSLQKMNKIAIINEMIDKMELNFKLGNSFY